MHEIKNSMTRQNFIRLIQEICDEEELVFTRFSKDWILVISDRNKKETSAIYGYNFSINTSTSSQICQDKNATYVILHAAGVQAVPHELFMNPSDPLVSDYIPQSGSICTIIKYASKFDYKVVLKPIRGTGGNGVLKATNCKEVESAILQLFQKDYGLVVSPFVEINREIRVVVLNNECRLVYEKRRPCVIGDGISTVAKLAANDGHQYPAGEGAVVPKQGHEFPLEWRHNLGHGSRADILPPNDSRMEEIHSIALQTIRAIGIKFCSVDIVEDMNGSLSVLEVNSGVMMDSFIRGGLAEKEMAKKIYKDAIFSSFSL